MFYVTENGLEQEYVWNSRDGVTPFTIVNRAGDQIMQHTFWNADRYLPHYKPKPSDRVFTDLTPEYAERLAVRKVQRYWEDELYALSEHYANWDEAVRDIAQGFLQPGAPMIVEYWQLAATIPPEL